jgi:DNA polymerase-3 subunit delta
MEPAELEQALEEGRLGPVYLLHGADVFQRDRMVARIADSVPENMRDFNLQTCLSDETSAGEVLGLARTMPFFGARVVIVRGVDRYSADDLSLFLNYFQDPNDRTVLAMTADKVDSRLKFSKFLKDRNWSVEFQAPKGRGLTAWVREAMKSRGQGMTPEAAEELILRIGTDLTELDHELEKISRYAVDRREVSRDDVITASRLGQTATVFKLSDAVGEQDPGKALAALKELLDREHHLPVFVMLVRHFRLLLKARLLLDARAPQAEWGKQLGLPPFIIRNYMNQARGLDFDMIKKGLACLLEANLTLVKTQAPERLVMDKLVLDLASLRPVRRPGL